MLDKLLVAVVAIGFVAWPAAAQDAKDLVGTWLYVSNQNVRADGAATDAYGPNPKGGIIFDASGYFSSFIAQAQNPKFASSNRTEGTPEENKAAVRNAIALFGRYKVEGNTLTYAIEASSFPNWYGVTQKRQFTIAGNELRFTNPAGSTGITVVGVLKRAK